MPRCGTVSRTMKTDPRLYPGQDLVGKSCIDLADWAAPDTGPPKQAVA